MRVLVVCSANICRSPFGADVLRTYLASAGVDALVTSAGTDAYDGSARCQELARVSGLVPGSGGVSKALTVDDIAAADLVLTMERQHRSAVVALVPLARNRTFTLIEAARVAGAIVAPGHTLDVATGRAIVDDPLDELAKVPALPTWSEGRSAWLVSEMNVWRGRVGNRTMSGVDGARDNDSIPDPHVTSVSHAAVAARIGDEMRSVAASVAICLSR